MTLLDVISKFNDTPNVYLMKSHSLERYVNRSTDRGGMGADCPSLEPERGLLKVLNVTWMNATIFKCRPFNETRAIAH